MVLRRFLGSQNASSGPPSEATLALSETATVRKIVAQLEALPSDRARHLAGFAYILGRAANADMDMTDEETRLIERIVMEHGELPEAQAILVVEIAKQQERLIGETEDYLVTREWVRGTELDERVALLRCCFLVGAADDSISAEESATLNEIGHELLLDDPTIARVRGEFTDRFAAVQAMRAESSGGR
jgi:uncharacterized tellurite resistance protein B-like protein